jgi:uncharacterized protein YcbX
MPLVVSELCVYPIKSCGGVILPSAHVEERGFADDRRWMLVDEQGGFLSQRKIPSMALIEVLITGDHLTVRAPTMDDLAIARDPEPAHGMRTTIWNDTVRAEPYPDDINRWFSEVLGISCRLVKFPEQVRRPVDPRYAHAGEHTAFSDGYPFLVLSEASLDDLNSQLAEPVPMNRFRPNIVIRGCAPYAEDSWGEFRIGSVTFRSAKPCARCRVTTVDQTTGESGEEPLRTLTHYRARGAKVLFGQNLLHSGRGMLSVGDPVHILTQGTTDGT